MNITDAVSLVVAVTAAVISTIVLVISVHSYHRITGRWW